MTRTLIRCDRCGCLLVAHYDQQQPDRWIGCPVPPGLVVPKATCAFQGCHSEQNDPVYGLCPQHYQQAAVVTQPRWRPPTARF